MGVNLVPKIGSVPQLGILADGTFKIKGLIFSDCDCAVLEGCTVSGPRKLLQFDFFCCNVGDTDCDLGRPTSKPQWFEYFPCHRHFHLKNFNQYRLYYRTQGGATRWITGYKQSFCLEDTDAMNLAAGTKLANRQGYLNCVVGNGISTGCADRYGVGTDCQWIDITGLPDGEYVLEAQTNVSGVVKEDSYGDNVTWAGVRITGMQVQEIPPDNIPFYPEDLIGLNIRNIKTDGAMLMCMDSAETGYPVADFCLSCPDPVDAQKFADQGKIILQRYSLSRLGYVGWPGPADGDQLMTYFLTYDSVPLGPPQADEDPEDVDPNTVMAKKVPHGDYGRWTVTDMVGGKSREILNFGVSEANARKAAWIINKYKFTKQCFVGRPDKRKRIAPLMYFLK